MKRALCLGTALVITAALAMFSPALGQFGPGQQGAVLKNPFMESTSTPATAPTSKPVQPTGNGAYVQGMWNQNAPQPATHTAFLNPTAQQQPKRTASDDPYSGLSLPDMGPDPNQDILVTEKNGPWMISVASYMGPESSRMARAMATELKNKYQMQSYVFSRGREERKKEYERVKELLEKQRKFFEEKNLPPPSNLRIGYRNIQEQCAVLVGNYSTLDIARRELDKIRRLQPPDPSLDKQYFFMKKDPKTGKSTTESVAVNPFLRAFVVHNPALKQDEGVDANMDIAMLRQLNRGAENSLLNCKKPYTLVVKQFFTPSTIQSSTMKNSPFLDALSLGSNDREREDVAAQNAHTLADVFRKQVNLDSYVLHTRFSSIVTVGSFDTLQDPRIESTRHMLKTQLGVPEAIPMRVPQ